MTKTFLTAAVLAAATFATGAYAQSYDQGGSGMQGTQQQQYDASPSSSSSSSPQYYNYQGQPTGSPAGMQESGQNGQYVDPKGYEVPNGRPNNYARELKDGPMGTSPGA
ncbi:hypothetical protein [Herbaspirillum sp. VT-16-41]|jgi:hypothetical protein|uniref:hypothetical protein n=1 Tax=Herbaspirillum sp. VT-16-41 TaxID=1953765 RepID=UPI00098107F8|nr:hypothetical protein [Herbaspirillum sp. VT-16-41]ONN64922.1 hypothetical protein BTM36_19030 [Herbaspirillum sp. VT-16-41]